eukprot:TRINITY_DN16530_c0_g1_i1.p1 TRINITY_DN16530_c0_g1~~TRINITY_DN16530_c0_g1_i1.p1  ORF type:complete len:778 (+),score=145.84 TRINITY_DN16530_c0_g1_i1:149-2482(+)
MELSDYNSDASSDLEVEQLLRGADEKSTGTGIRERVIHLDVSPKCAAVSREAMAAAEAGVNILSESADILGGGAVLAGTAGTPASASRRCVSSSLTEAKRWSSLCQPLVALKSLTAVLKTSRFLRRCHEVPGVFDSVPTSDEALLKMTVSAHADVRTRVLSDYSATIKKGLDTGVVTNEHHIQLKELEAQQTHEEGMKQKEAGNSVGALSCFYKVLNIRKSIQGENHPHTAVARSFIATSLRDNGDYEESLSELRAAIATQRVVFPPNHPHIAVTQNNIGAILRQLGRPEEALVEHSQAFQILVSFYNTHNHPFAAEVQEHIGHTFKLMGDRNAATAAYQRSYDIRVSVLGVNHPKTQKLLERLATLPSTWAAPTSMKVVREQKPHSRSDWTCPTCSVSNQKGTTTCRCGYEEPMDKSGIEQIFDGCVFAFSGMIPKSLHPSRWKEWKYAEQCGARIQEEVTECVTHVIFKEGYEKSEKVKRAQMMGIAVVPADWFYYGIEWGVRFPDNSFSSRICDKSARTRRSHSCPGKRHLLSEPVRSSVNILPPPKPLVAVPPAGSPKKRVTPGDESFDVFTQSSRSPMHTPVPVRPETPLVVNVETPRIVTVEENNSTITPRSSTWGCSSAFSAINSMPRTGSFTSNGGSSAGEVLSVGSNAHTTVKKMSTPWGNRKVTISSNLAPVNNAADEATAGDMLWNAASQGGGLSPSCTGSRVSFSGASSSGVYSGKNVIASQVRKNIMRKAYAQQRAMSQQQQSPPPRSTTVSSATNVTIKLNDK